MTKESEMPKSDDIIVLRDDRFELIGGHLYQIRGLKCRRIKPDGVSKWFTEIADTVRHWITREKALAKIAEWGLTVAGSAPAVAGIDRDPHAVLTEAMARIMRKRHHYLAESDRKLQQLWPAAASYDQARASALHQAYSIIESLREELKESDQYKS